jgi:hypothetical protein
VTKPIVSIGKVFIDSKGAGRIYLRKKLLEYLNFVSGEEVRIVAYPEKDVIVISKLNTEKSVKVVVAQPEDVCDNKKVAFKLQTYPSILLDCEVMKNEIEQLKKEIEELKKRMG